MFCPRCRAEYRQGFHQCVDCEVALVDALPEPATDEGSELVPVFQTTDSVFLAIVKSLLESSDIPCLVQGEEALGLLPVGRFGASVSRASLCAVVHVRKEDAENVEELLRELERDLAVESD